MCYLFVSFLSSQKQSQIQNQSLNLLHKNGELSQMGIISQFLFNPQMASISSNSPHTNLHTIPIIICLPLSSSSPPSLISFPFHLKPSHKPRFSALRIGPDSIIRTAKKPPAVDVDAGSYSYGDSDDEDGSVDEGGIDWEDQILEDTVPLVGFVRMLLHSDKYESGQRLSPEHERIILERLIPYHPECQKKIGSGVDYITVGYHPDFESSRCLFIARKNGELEDFSYWKCIKGLIRQKYPLYADSFILRHFRKRRHFD